MESHSEKSVNEPEIKPFVLEVFDRSGWFSLRH